MQSHKERFNEVLIGFESFSFTEQQIKECLPDFETVLRDYKCCLYCKVGRDKAQCMTSVGDGSYRGYFGLSKKGCSMYGQPSFAVHKCPGPVERREQIAKVKTARREDPLFAGSKDPERDASVHYTDR